MTKKKKKLLIIAIALASVIILGTVGTYIAVNTAFSKVTESVGKTMEETGEAVDLPVLDNKNAVDKTKHISVVLDVKTMKKLESKVSVSDKLAVLGILAKSLSKDDYQTLLSYAVGGVDNKKFKAAYELIRTRLGQREKDQIKSYYAKYLHLLEE